ncbi:MAG: 50S ribosomal protein L4 [Planctomycetota bacterium]
MADVKSLSGDAVGTMALDVSAFEGRPNPVVLREAVLMYEARKRVGTASTKTRSEIRGTTHKMSRQKGGGRARHGDRKAPQFRGGGVAHGPRPRDYSYSMPRKALRRALRIALGGKLRDGEVVRWEGESLIGDKPSTKAVRTALDHLGAVDSALLVAAGPVEPGLLLSVRNLPRVRVLPASDVNAYDLVRHHWLVLLDGAYEVLCERVGATEATEGSAS